MSEEDDAYAEALRRIEKARVENADELDLRIGHLKTIPAEISDLTELSYLDLSFTQVSDITPLAALKNLSQLNLTRSNVSDLTPLAALKNLAVLFLADTQASDLEPLSALTNLSVLYAATNVSDLTPLASLKELRALDIEACPVRSLYPISKHLDLRELSLDGTAIADLRPVAEMRRLAEDPEGEGFTFGRSLATRLDPRLADLSQIQGNAERARETFAYLDSLGPEYDAFLKRRMIEEGIDQSDYFPDDALLPDPPDQDDLLRVTQTPDGRLDISPATPAPEELTDTVKRRAHEKLQEAARSLADIAGNRYPRLARTTRTLLDHIDAPFETLDMLDIHFELEALRGTYLRRAERTGEDVFDDDTVDALDRVLLIGPGLTLDNAQVTLLETRRDRFADMPSAPQRDAQDNLSESITLDPALFGDVMRGYATVFHQSTTVGSERLQAGQSILNRNTVIYVGTAVVSGMTGGALGVVGTDMMRWLASQADPILTLAPTWGAAFEAWITPILMRLREVNAGVRGVVKKP